MGFKYIEGSLEVTDTLNVKGGLEVTGNLSVEGDYIYARNEIAVGDNDEVMITSAGVSVNGNPVVTQEELQTLRSDIINGNISIGSVEEADVADKAYKDGLDNVITATYQTKTDNSLTTTNKTVVGAINEVNSKTVDKVSSIEQDTTFSSFSYNAKVGITRGVERTLLDEEENTLGVYTDYQRTPIVAGDNVTFTKDDTNQVIKINAEMSEVANALNADHADEADRATKATNDGQNRSIVDTYETKTDAADKLKAAKDYTDTEIDYLVSGEVVIPLYETKTDAATKLTTINTELEKIKNGAIDYVTKASFVLDETTGTLTITIT